MEANIIRVAELLDSSEKIEGKLHIIDVCYDIMEVIHDGSRKEDAEKNVFLVEKIVESIVKKIEKSEEDSMNAESFIESIYKYLYKTGIVVTPGALLKIKIVEEHYAEKMKRSSYVRIIDSFDDLDLLDKSCLTIVYKQYSGFLMEGAYGSFGPEKGNEIIDEFTSKSLGVLTTSLDDAMIDDEMTIDQLVGELHYKFAKLSKDIYLDKYKNGDLNLSKCALSKLFAGKKEKEIIPIFISDIYDRTAFINEESSDDEFVKDCCDLLNISPEEYEKSLLLPGKVSYLKLTRLMKQLNSKKDEE